MSWTAPEAAQRTIERQPGSVADSVRQMMDQWDEKAAEWNWMAAQWAERENYPTDNEAFHLFLTDVFKQLKGSSAVQNFRQKMKASTAEVTAYDIEAVFRAYEQALTDAVRRLRPQISQRQVNELQRAKASLDWGIKDTIVQHILAAQAGDGELHFSAQDFFLLLNPKALRIEYMEAKETLHVIHHIGSRASRDQLVTDLRQYQLPAVDATLDKLAH